MAESDNYVKLYCAWSSFLELGQVYYECIKLIIIIRATDAQHV